MPKIKEEHSKWRQKKNDLYSSYLEHHGIKGQKWGVRRYQNDDGTLTEAGKKRVLKTDAKVYGRLLKDAQSRSKENPDSWRYGSKLDKAFDEVRDFKKQKELERGKKYVDQIISEYTRQESMAAISVLATTATVAVGAKIVSKILKNK